MELATVVSYNAGLMYNLPDIPEINLAQLFRSVREEAKLTQKEMAELLGASERGYQHWEEGTRTPNGKTTAKVLWIRDYFRERHK